MGGVPRPLQYKCVYHAVSENRNGGGTQCQTDPPGTESGAEASQAGGAAETPQSAGVLNTHTHVSLYTDVQTSEMMNEKR